MTRKWIMRALCILCLAAMLTGCGREPEVTETTIEVKKKWSGGSHDYRRFFRKLL